MPTNVSVFKRPITYCIFILAIMQLSTLFLRWHDFNDLAGAQNLEAPYHVLLTVTALNETKASNHWYLPTVTLGGDANKYISWGATVPTKTGDYIYTSFTPIGFLAPYFWFNVFELTPSIKNLAYFNYLLGTLSVLTVFILLKNLLEFNGHIRSISLAGALVGSTIAIFSRESLLSHGVIYWSQCLYQPLLIFTLYLFFKYISCTSNLTSRNNYAKALILAAFIGASTEWTGYIFNAGIIMLLLMKSPDFEIRRRLAIHITIVTALAAVLTIVHLGLAVGFESAVKALSHRFFARSSISGSFLALIQGYFLSYGLFIITIIGASIVIFFKKLHKIRYTNQVILMVFLAACIPLVENLLMLQHATQFSFDRLKFILPASIILAFSFAYYEVRGRIILSMLILASSLYGWKSYVADNKNHAEWKDINLNNKELAMEIAKKIDTRCATFSSNLGVRGYANLLFHRSIYEGKSLEQINEHNNKNNTCASVFIEGSQVFPDLPKYTKAVIMFNDGRITEVYHDDNE